MQADQLPLQRGDFVVPRKQFKGMCKGHVIKIHPNGNAATVYWEDKKRKEVELIADLIKTHQYDLKKGDLVRYTDNQLDSNKTKLKKGTLGIVTRVLKKSIEVYWTSIGLKKQHNTHKTVCYVEKVKK